MPSIVYKANCNIVVYNLLPSSKYGKDSLIWYLLIVIHRLSNQNQSVYKQLYIRSEISNLNCSSLNCHWDKMCIRVEEHNKILGNKYLFHE